MGKRDIMGLFDQDLSAGTDTFRESLLRRCLSELDSDDHVVPLGDSELEMLVAAGDVFAMGQERPFSGDGR